MIDRVVTNARLLDATGERPGNVLIRNGVIEAAGPEVTAPDLEPRDARGAYLFPCAIDFRAERPGDERVPHNYGIGKVAEYPPSEDPRQRLNHALPYAAITKARAGQTLADLFAAHRSAVAFSDGNEILPAPLLRAALIEARNLGIRIVTHPGEPSLTANTCATESPLATLLGLPAAPAAAEAIGVARDIALARLTGAALHLANITTAAAIALIRQAKDEGLAITADTAPPYFALNETEIGEYDTAFRLWPPLRAEADRQAVRAALIDGTIDVIASNHAAIPPEEKDQPFALATPGGAGWATLLPLAFAHLPPVRAITCLTTSPARILGLRQPRIAPGEPADLVLFDPDKPWVVPASPPSPFARRPMSGAVVERLHALEPDHP